MSSKLIKIEKDNLNLAWGDASSYLESALFQTPEYDLMDIHRLVEEGALTLWIFYNVKRKRAFGAMVTNIIEHPHKRTLFIFLLGADDFKEVLPLFDSFLDYARHIKANDIECAGRFGLEKLLGEVGFKKSYIVMNIDVN